MSGRNIQVFMRHLHHQAVRISQVIWNYCKIFLVQKSFVEKLLFFMIFISIVNLFFPWVIIYDFQNALGNQKANSESIFSNIFGVLWYFILIMQSLSLYVLLYHSQARNITIYGCLKIPPSTFLFFWSIVVLWCIIESIALIQWSKLYFSEVQVWRATIFALSITLFQLIGVYIFQKNISGESLGSHVHSVNIEQYMWEKPKWNNQGNMKFPF